MYSILGRASSNNQFRKSLRNIGISVGVLLILSVVAGLAYVFITDRESPHQAATAPVVAQDQGAVIKPTPPGPNVPENAAVEALSTPVAAGSNASISIKTNATSTCTISVVYNGKAAKDSGLGPKVADDFGSITWSWTVDPDASVGNWPITVLCHYHGRSAMVQGIIQITT